MADVGRMLDQPQPAELLHLASSVLAVADPRADLVADRRRWIVDTPDRYRPPS